MQLATPLFLDWSEVAITFDRDDHPDYVPNPRVYPLVIDPIIANTRLTKVLMDGRSNLNIIYSQTLDLLGIARTHLRPSVGGFHGVMSGKRAEPVGRVDLPACFGTPTNFRKETLTFEVVEFYGTYHVILGHPCYARFMAVPNYTYFKLKILGPNGVITIGPSYEHAYECDVECVEHGEASWNRRPWRQTSTVWPKRSPTPNDMPATSSPRKTSSSYPMTLPTRMERH
jgi:hypothetical protein